MSNHRRALRVLTPALLLLLSACSDKAQVANTTQDVLDAKNPGIVGAISNAVGSSTGNPEIDAAIGAASVIKNMEANDRLVDDARAAAAKDDAATAEAKLKAAQDAKSHRFLEVTALGIALQCGEDSATVRRTMLETEAKSDGNTQAEAGYLIMATDEGERVLQALNKMNLSKAERQRRQANTAATMAHLYTKLASIYAARNPNDYMVVAMRNYADRYQKMRDELEAGPNGAY